MNRLFLTAALLVALVAASADALKCHKCGTSSTTCPDTYLDGDDAELKVCEDDVDYCYFALWTDDDDEMKMSGCGSGKLEDLSNAPADGKCKSDFDFGSISDAKFCVCKSDECNGAVGLGGGSAAAAAATLGMALVAAIYGGRF